jgi:hypothetical protein
LHTVICRIRIGNSASNLRVCLSPPRLRCSSSSDGTSNNVVVILAAVAVADAEAVAVAVAVAVAEVVIDLSTY